MAKYRSTAYSGSTAIRARTTSASPAETSVSATSDAQVSKVAAAKMPKPEDHGFDDRLKVEMRRARDLQDPDHGRRQRRKRNGRNQEPLPDELAFRRLRRRFGSVSGGGH